MDRRSGDRLTVAGFVLLVVLVGTNLVAIRYSNRELPPFWNAGFRFALASGLFTLLVVARRPPRPAPRQVLGGVVYGLLGFAGFFGFLYLGLVQATAALGQTMLALGPLLTMFLAALAGLERLRLRSLVGAVVSIGGIAVVFGSDASLAVPATSLLALLAAATSFSAAGIVAKLLRGAEPVMQNAIATGIGAIVLLGISAIRAETWTLPHTPGTWLAFAYLVVPGTVVIFLLFLALLRRWSATAVSYQFILAPIVSIALATQVLGEPIRPEVVVGAVLVLVGVYIGAIARGPAPPADATGA